MRELRDDEKLVMAAARLKTLAPEAYNELLEQIAVRSLSRTRDLVAADSGRILAAQGAAKEILQLVEILKTAPETAEAIRKSLTRPTTAA